MTIAQLASPATNPNHARAESFIELEPDIAATILHAIRDGWKLAHTASDVAVNPNSSEREMTEYLRAGMLEGQKIARQLLIARGTEIRSPGARIPDGLTDISIFLRNNKQTEDVHDPHAIIECKRIAASRTDLCREYVVAGMDRFISQQYGANHSSGFMVGYVLSGTPAQSVAKINAYLKRKSRTQDQLKPQPPQTNSTWQSRHSRKNQSPALHLHHALLRC